MTSAKKKALGESVKRLRSRRPIGDRLRTAKGLERLLDREQRRRLQFGQRTATADGNRDGGHRHVVGRFPEVVGVIRSERVPEAVQLPAD